MMKKLVQSYENYQRIISFTENQNCLDSCIFTNIETVFIENRFKTVLIPMFLLISRQFLLGVSSKLS